MATADLYLTSTVSAGSIGSPANALGAPNGVYTTDTTKNAWTARWTLDAIAGTNIVSNAGHTISIRARKSSTGGADVTIETATLYQGATTIPLITSPVTVTGTGVPGQDVVVGFDGTLLTGLENVEIQIQGSGAGGGPNERGCEIDAVTWTADYTALFGVPMNVYQGGQWVGGYLKYYDGIDWVEKPAKVYQSGVWVTQ